MVTRFLIYVFKLDVVILIKFFFIHSKTITACVPETLILSCNLYHELMILITNSVVMLGRSGCFDMRKYLLQRLHF